VPSISVNIRFEWRSVKMLSPIHRRTGRRTARFVGNFGPAISRCSNHPFIAHAVSFKLKDVHEAAALSHNQARSRSTLLQYIGMFHALGWLLAAPAMIFCCKARPFVIDPPPKAHGENVAPTL
jgi:hypothetical protein